MYSIHRGELILFYDADQTANVQVDLYVGRKQALTWMKVFRFIPEFRILRLTFQRKSASKC